MGPDSSVVFRGSNKILVETTLTAHGHLAERLFSDLFLNAIPDGVAVLRDGQVVQANAALGELLRVPPERLVGADLLAMLTACDHDGAPDLNAPMPVRAVLRIDPEAPKTVSLNARFVESGSPSPHDRIALVTLRDISHVADMERRLRESEDQYRSIFENAQEGIYQTTPDGRYIRVNPALARIYGFASPEDLIGTLSATRLYVDPAQRDHFKQLMNAHGVVRDWEAQIWRRDGTPIWITENARCVRGPDGEIRYYEGTVEDVTDRKRAEEEIRLLAKVFESSAEGIVLLDDQGRVRAANPQFCAITGTSECDLRDELLVLTAEGLHESDFFARALAEVRDKGKWEGEIFARRRGPEPSFPAEVSIAAVRDPEGAVTHYVVNVADISRRKEDEAFIRFHANYDMLTRLPNRRLVIDRLEKALEESKKSRTRGCVLFLDLDRFKVINDSYGHAAGDELLKMVAKRLRHTVRPEDTIGRLGGDEFVILLNDVQSENAGPATAEKVLYSMSEPFKLRGTEQFCIPSIGITYFPDHGTGVGDILRAADIAMYRAKKNAERRWAVYEPSMAGSSVQLLNLENELRMAAGRGELELFYQPKVSADGLAVVGAEALVRWRHPTLGLIAPGAFIPLAEETGLIVPIGRWVLRRACLQMVRWLRAGLDIPSVSVNVSARQFQDPGFVASVRAILDETQLDPGFLDLEITESVVSGDVTRAVATLQGLKAMGVTLSMDDFGTGYSSLTYLKTFPIDTLKIDQSFVRELHANPKDDAIVSTIIALAMNLGFKVVAEGVETEEHAERLNGKGCHMFQGYWIAKPLPAPEFADFLRARLPRVAND